MPLRLLRFCRACLTTRQSTSSEPCHICGNKLLPLLDEHGALCRDFLLARGSCCSSGCRNCPYPKSPAAPALADSAPATIKSCPRCQTPFECRGGGCWCASVRLSPATLRWLGRTYEDCLCPTCLSDFAMM